MVSIEQRQDPWAILKINPTNSEREIKVAYARQLKVTRPEDNLDAFQILVDARDYAMAYARGINASGNGAQFDASSSGHRTDASTEADVVPPTVVTAFASSGWYEESHIEAGQTINSSGHSKAEDILARPDLATTARNISDILKIDSDMSMLANSQASQRSLPTLSLEDRELAEFILLESVRDYVNRIECLPMREYLQEVGWMELPPVPDYLREISYFRDQTEAHELRKARRLIVLELDNEFGWTTDERRISKFIGFHTISLVDGLRRLRNPDSPIVANDMEQSTAHRHSIGNWLARVIGYLVIFGALAALNKCG